MTNGKEKYCPILSRVLEGGRIQYVVCIRDRCSWWDESFGRCSKSDVGKTDGSYPGRRVTVKK